MKQSKTNDTSEIPYGIVYVQDCASGKASNLYKLDLKTGKTELVGAITDDIYDIAAVGSALYGLDQEENSDTTSRVGLK